MATKIERSTGLYTGYMGYFCGNGYEGLTKELDNTVKREAELLTTTHIGIRITEKEYEQMDKLYNSKLSSLIDNYISAAIEYGMEVGSKQAEDCRLENKYYETRFVEEALEKANVSSEIIKKVKDILGGNYETP